MLVAREYRTIKCPVAAELVEKRSRFVANLFPVSTQLEAMERFSLMCRKFYDARHNVYAYVLMSGKSKFSDCGEPGGTAGKPVLGVLEKKRIFDVIAVVSRYFGGVLLGKGGLVRAYSSVVLKALDVAEFVNMVVCDYCRAVCSYVVLTRTFEILEGFGVFFERKVFGERVTLFFYSDVTETLNLKRRLCDVSAGTTRFEVLERRIHNLNK